MTSIKLIVTGATARAEVDGLLTSGMVGIPVTIEYDSAWDGLTKNLVCKSTSGGTRVQLDVGNSSTVPHEVMAYNEKMYYIDKLFIGVEGFNSDGTLVIPTKYAECGRIWPGADSDADPSADPTLPIWAQLEQRVEDLEQNGGGGSGADGEDGGYYVPSVSQPGENVVQFDFTPSKEDMPAVAAVQVELPDSTKNAYVLPVGGDELGGVKNGGNVVINEDGTMTAPEGTAETVELDTTLTVAGKAADAKSVGDALANVGNPTDEQVATAVQTYLEEHPEATTTVADGSITEEKLADGAVTEKKAGFLVFVGNSANLFNKATVTDGYSLESYNGMKVNETYSVSDYIPVTESTVYIRSADTSPNYVNTHYYDLDKNYLSYARHYTNGATFTTPAGCAYVRITLLTEYKDTTMICLGSVLPSEYVPYRLFYKLGDAIQIAVDNIDDLDALFAAAPVGSVPKDALAAEVTEELDSVNPRIKVGTCWNDVRKTTETLSGRVNVFENVVKGVLNIASDISEQTVVVHGVNYFDKDDLILGNISFTTGAIDASTTNYITDRLIPVQPGKQLFWNRSNADGVRSYLSFHYYDQNQQWLRYKLIGGVNLAGRFTPEDDVYFIRVQCGGLVDAEAEKICVADVDIGNTLYGGYDGNSSITSAGAINGCYFGKNVYMPYIGYRVENGVLVGASDTFTVEEITHVDVFDSVSAIEVSVPVEEFDKEKLRNVTLKFGRYADTDYVIARIFKSTITGGTITPRVVAVTPGGVTMREYIKSHDFIMGINAGIFDMTDNSCLGTTIVDGVVVTDHVDATTCGLSDTLCVDGSGNFVSYAYDTTTADMLTAGVTQAVQGWCTIIADYAPTDLTVKTEEVSLPDETNTVLTTKHPRTAVGQYADGDYFIFICGGRETNQAGMTCAEMQEIFVADGVKYAYNLDGGGSCNMMYYKKELAPYTEGRADPSYIVFN